MSRLALCGCDKVPFWVDPRNQQLAESAGLVLLALAAGVLVSLYLVSRWRNRHISSGPDA
jgi:hypothetical protein